MLNRKSISRAGRMKNKVLFLLGRGLISLAILVALAALVITAFLTGKIQGALNPVRNAEKPMCVNREVDIREAPTGYVIGTVPAGSMVWFMRLDLPFAYVSFYDGVQWLEGSITASVLEVCR